MTKNKKYTLKDIDKLRSKFNSKTYSKSWLHEHFSGMANYIQKLLEEKNELS